MKINVRQKLIIIMSFPISKIKVHVKGKNFIINCGDGAQKIRSLNYNSLHHNKKGGWLRLLFLDMTAHVGCSQVCLEV